jgi:methylase of polypeptide subunit release factors
LTIAPTQAIVNRDPHMTNSHHSLASLATTLRAAGYTREVLARETSVRSRVRHPELVPVAMLLQTERADTPLAQLVRLFQLGGTVSRASAEELLTDIDCLADAGLLEADGDHVTGLLRIDEYDGLLLACDRDTSRPDYVMGMSPSTTVTIAHTPRVHTEVALDVGTGSGVHALLAARHAERVVATDVSPRALWMTRLNAELNGMENVETREGSFFEPVEGERFGLVISNPPYIVSPDTSFSYRDSGMEGDSLCRSMLADLPALLEPGGHATLQGNWIHGADEKWWRPIGASVAEGCDAFMLRIQTDDPLEYAARWSEGHHRGDPAGFESTVRRWLDHYADTGVERISGAMVMLRRRSSGSGQRRAVTLAKLPDEPTGAAFAQLFEAQDRLDGLDDEALARTPLRRADGLRVERYERPGGETKCVLECPSALGVRRPVSPELADLVEQLDGAPQPGLRELVKLGYLVFDDAAG